MFTRFHCHPSDTPPQCPAHVFTVIPLTPHHNAQYGLTNIPPMVRCIEQIFAHQYALLTLYYNPYTPITPICPTLHTPHLLQYALHSVHPTYFNMPYLQSTTLRTPHPTTMRCTCTATKISPSWPMPMSRCLHISCALSVVVYRYCVRVCTNDEHVGIVRVK